MLYQKPSMEIRILETEEDVIYTSYHDPNDPTIDSSDASGLWGVN